MHVCAAAAGSPVLTNAAAAAAMSDDFMAFLSHYDGRFNHGHDDNSIEAILFHCT
jgi:hypothetical protein